MRARAPTGKPASTQHGSFGRWEASEHSDLDLFIVGKRDGQPKSDGKEGSLLTRLDEICIKADLIEATRALKIPEFSGDGQYLTHYSVDEFTKTLGTPEDDVANTFTARLLLRVDARSLSPNFSRPGISRRRLPASVLGRRSDAGVGSTVMGIVASDFRVRRGRRMMGSVWMEVIVAV
jgi:hypothetical protein